MMEADGGLIGGVDITPWRLAPADFGSSEFQVDGEQRKLAGPSQITLPTQFHHSLTDTTLTFAPSEVYKSFAAGTTSKLNVALPRELFSS